MPIILTVLAIVVLALGAAVIASKRWGLWAGLASIAGIGVVGWAIASAGWLFWFANT